MTAPRTAAGRDFLLRLRYLIGQADGRDIYHFTDAILAIEAQAAQPDALWEALPKPDLLMVRTTLIDAIGIALSKEFAQGNPFEPFDRVYVLKVITRVLDDARARAALTAPAEVQP